MTNHQCSPAGTTTYYSSAEGNIPFDLSLDDSVAKLDSAVRLKVGRPESRLSHIRQSSSSRQISAGLRRYRKCSSNPIGPPTGKFNFLYTTFLLKT